MDDEIRKAAGDGDKEEDATMQSGTVQKMVTSDGRFSLSAASHRFSIPDSL